jgi:hypothetical protein
LLGHDRGEPRAPLAIPGGVEKIDSTPGAKKNATDDAPAGETY